MSDNPFAITCHGRVWADWKYVSCSARAKVERDGRHYCGRHDPVAVKKKQEARAAVSNAKWTQQSARLRLAGAAPELLAELTMICNALEGCGTDLPPEVEARIAFARAAIAKATGETK